MVTWPATVWLGDSKYNSLIKTFKGEVTIGYLNEMWSTVEEIVSYVTSEAPAVMDQINVAI